MKKHARLAVRLTFSMMLFSSTLLGQSNLRQDLFGTVENLMAKAKEARAEFYAPSSYQKALGYYNDAVEKYNNGKSIEDIGEKTRNAEAYFAKALDASKKGEEAFRSTTIARKDATTAGALRSSLEIFNKAEEKFIRAAYKLEDGDEAGALQNSHEAETLYRSSELEAIKANFLTPARELLKIADDTDVKDNAPKTLVKSQRLVHQVETLLKGNRYDTDSARDLAQEARYEAAHAIYLHKLITGLKKQNRTYEDVLLEAETQLQRIAGGLGIHARFDSGFGGPVNEVNAAIHRYDLHIMLDADSIHQLADLLRQKDNGMDNYRKQIGDMTTRLGTLTDAEKKLQDEGKKLELHLALSHEQENIFRNVSTMFTEDEGTVLRQGDNIVIRLYGVSFPVGRSSIEPEYYPLLTKVQEAIKKFPNCSVTIEGHTDSQGPDDKNQTLSESRAKAVAEYLMANMNVQKAINSHGYGESRPIATNDTPEGRAKNRRIDVVISPEGAAQ